MEQNSEKSPADLAAHIRSRLSGLSGAEARVAHTVLDLGERLVGLSVSEVAALAETAPSSVVRTCQRLEFRGFQELKIAAARQAPHPPGPADGFGDAADPAARALASTLAASREALDGLRTTLPPARLGEAARLLHGASRVLVVGAGLSRPVVADTAYRLRAVGRVVDAPADPLTAQLSAGLLTDTSVCLAVSHTG
ncbi:MurR/RpiR family transcriptional regulator, partial [Streptomyces sp. SPB074]|uniref:MurR/RpiR family transcriptional regulator n=1 Tax=Streptomyces sp. (strain SPB074) TaxID=465543 RepID=UPI0001D1DD90